MDPPFQGPRGSSELDNLEETWSLEETWRSRLRASRLLPINPYALRPREYMTEVTFITSWGNTPPISGAFCSRRWPQAAIASRLADVLGYPRIDLAQSDIQRFMTPRGSIQSTQAVIAYFCLASRPNQFIPFMLYILEDRHYGHLGVSIIAGNSLLSFLDSQEPLSQNIPDHISVATHEGATPTFVEVIDYPRGGPRYTDWREAMTTDTINNWLANSVRIPE